MQSDLKPAKKVEGFFTNLIETHGAVPKGAFYPDPEQQRTRYDELALLFTQSSASFTLLDYGCGYGAFYDYLVERGVQCDYWGYDISPAMLSAGREQHPQLTGRFLDEVPADLIVDYVIVSGTFNQRVGTEVPAWEALIHATLDDFDRRTRLGFAFNMLSAYRDEHRKLELNYYGDPLHYFDHCFRKYSPNIGLAHDYNLWDFTIRVRKLPPRTVSRPSST